MVEADTGGDIFCKGPVATRPYSRGTARSNMQMQEHGCALKTSDLHKQAAEAMWRLSCTGLLSSGRPGPEPCGYAAVMGTTD